MNMGGSGSSGSNSGSRESNYVTSSQVSTPNANMSGKSNGGSDGGSRKKKSMAPPSARKRKWGAKDGMQMLANYMLECPPHKLVAPPAGMSWGVCSKCGAGFNFATGKWSED